MVKISFTKKSIFRIQKKLFSNDYYVYVKIDLVDRKIKLSESEFFLVFIAGSTKKYNATQENKKHYTLVADFKWNVRLVGEKCKDFMLEDLVNVNIVWRVKGNEKESSNSNTTCAT